MSPLLRCAPVIAVAALLAACAPAGLQRATGVDFGPDDLQRGLRGSDDPQAVAALGRWIAENHGSSGARTVGGLRVRFVSDRGAIPVEAFESLQPAGEFRIRGLDRHHRIDGLGVPMIGHRPNDGSRPTDRWHPPEGIFRAVTAVPTHRADTVEIRLYDRLGTEQLRFDGRPRTLAGDLSAPWAALLEETTALRTTAVTSLITRDTGRASGFFLVEDYDPDKEPVILIHGLLSTPLMWAELTNELWGDPRIRQRYQVWHYLYPTNAPALYPARQMRGQLDELRRALDPELDDPAMQRTVVIGHSMGGLLAKTLVVEPKTAFWDAAFTRSIDDLDITSAERATLEEAWFWQPRDHVDRVIFCAVPFRGSALADSFVGRIGQWISAPRDEWQDFYREIERRNPGMLTKDYEVLTKRKLSSVWALSTNVRSLRILDELPIRPGVGRHVIVGTRGRRALHQRLGT